MSRFGPFSGPLARGAAFIVGSEALFATMGAAVKAAAAGLPVATIVFFRSLVALLVLGPLMARRGGIGLRPGPGAWRLHLLRAGIGVSAMICFFHALAHLPLADGMLLKMTAPVFMPLIGLAWLGERVSPTAVLAVPVGLAGVVLVLDPSGRVETAALIGLAGGVLSAGAKVAVRRAAAVEPTARIVFWFAALAAAVTAPPALLQWRPPSATEWLLLAAVGLCAVGGQLLLTRGYATAAPGQIGPFTYTAVLFAAGYGALLWGEIPDAWFVAGALLVAVAGVLALRRERPPPEAVADEA